MWAVQTKKIVIKIIKEKREKRGLVRYAWRRAIQSAPRYIDRWFGQASAAAGEKVLRVDKNRSLNVKDRSLYWYLARYLPHLRASWPTSPPFSQSREAGNHNTWRGGYNATWKRKPHVGAGVVISRYFDLDNSTWESALCRDSSGKKKKKGRQC